MSKPKGPPLKVIDAVKRVSRGMSWLQRRMAPPAATLMEIASASWRPHALRVVAELGIADLLATGPQDVSVLADKTGTHEDALYRVLQPLAHDGLLASPAPRTFALNTLSEPLRSDHPQSMRQTIRQSMGAWNRPLWLELEETLRTGEPAFPRLHGGQDLWTWFAEEAPEQGRVFHDSMVEMTRSMLPLVLAAHDFGRYRRVLDIGGGQGALIAGLLAAHPDLRGGLFDMPDVLTHAPERLAEAGVHDRCELVEGSLFGELPRGWDAYIMKHILHGLQDEPLRELLGKVRGVLEPPAKLIVLEFLLPEDDQGTYPAFGDLLMMLTSGGRERTASQYRELFAGCGLRLEEVARTASPISLMVVSRA